MQKTTQVAEPERDFEQTGDPLAGSGSEQEQTDPDFAEHAGDEEAKEE